VTDVRRNAVLLAAVAAGTLAVALLRRRWPRVTEPGADPGPDPRAYELRRKLAQARDEAADEDDFEAAGMAGEAMVEDEPRPPSTKGDVDETRRRVHEDARAATEEMRRTGGSDR
jgi:hypothetical protein